MTRNEAREYIHEHSKEYATETWGRDKSGKGWICPLCGSGSGDKGTGITTKDGVHFTCWAGCFQSADVIDVIGLIQNIPEADHTAKFEAARREFRLDVDESAQPSRTTAEKDFKTFDKESEPEKARETLETFFLQANKHLAETDYHRGISLETLNRFMVGYVKRWRHPKAPHGVPATPRLIIPTGPASYIARDTRAAIPPEQEQYKKQQVGSRGKAIFNGEALTAAKGPIFITEGELDAMSVIDVGGEAVTAGSAGQWRNVLEAVKANPQPYPVIVALDNDETGGKNGRELKKTLAAEGMAFMDYKPPMGAKDANEALMKDRAMFTESVEAAIAHAMRSDEERQEEARQAYLDKSVAAHLPMFIQGIMNSCNAVCYPTGFSELDDILNGGLRPALYIMGAISSLGKTSFALQLADNVAVSGADVLFFSLEMSQDELIAKSLSRHSYQIAREKRLSLSRAKTTAGILAGSPIKGNRDEDTEILEAALMDYQQYAGRLFIRESGDTLGVDDVRAAVGEHIKITGRKPFVIIDYLQQLSRDDERDTDKQATDKAIKGLKHVSRDFDVPLLAISSFNRENYNSPVSMSHFKESGSIEYSCDVLIGLQYAFMDYKEGEDEKSRNKRIRRDQSKQDEISANGKPQRIEVRVLKNRNGRRGRVMLDFVSKYNYYSKPNDEEKYYSLIGGEDD